MYNVTSAYYNTPVNAKFMGMMVTRPIPKIVDDQMFEINTTYHLRPDLLAYDLYNDSSLWWVFAQRNPNTLKDPLFDFVQGTSIRLPRLSVLRKVLGF